MYMNQARLSMVLLDYILYDERVETADISIRFYSRLLFRRKQKVRSFYMIKICS